MENSFFDELTKALAGPHSRREALRRVGGLLGASFLAALGLSQPAEAAACAALCANVPAGAKRKACLKKCNNCPGARPGCLSNANNPNAVVCCPKGQKCCGFACCPKDHVCCEGFCCPPKTTCCNAGHGTSICAETQTDPANCGGCFVECATGETCEAGECQNPCADMGEGYTSCVDLAGELHCCPPDQICVDFHCQGICSGNTVACYSPTNEFFGCCQPNEVCTGTGCDDSFCEVGTTACEDSDQNVTCCDAGHSCIEGKCTKVCTPPLTLCPNPNDPAFDVCVNMNLTDCTFICCDNPAPGRNAFWGFCPSVPWVDNFVCCTFNGDGFQHQACESPILVCDPPSGTCVAAP